MYEKPINISTILNPDNINLAEFMSDEELDHLGMKLKKAYMVDLNSRAEWDKNMESWMKLAVQYKEEKSFPWPKAANVKYPLITTAAMQFAARAYPNLIVGKKPVKGRVIGTETPELTDIVKRISEHMSYQLMEENKNWEEEMDRMFTILPILGLSYKKTFHDPVKGVNRSQLILPRDLVVNYWAKNLEGNTRKHHKLEMDKNDIYTRIEMEMYLEVDLPSPRIATHNMAMGKPETELAQYPDEDDESVPYLVIECHCNWDLDQDGYHEPYIVTFEYDSATVLRVVPRFREESVKFSNKGKKPKVLCIEPDEYFTKYGFIPNPDGSFYDLGFGLLLGPLNESVNTAINQTLDQGTMYNTGGGFLGKGVRIKAGEYKLAPNEWKVVNTTTDDLRKAIFPNPVKNPSNIPMELAKLLIEGGNKVASIADIFTGKMPGQNTPATTTMETVKQSSAVFTAIYKRIYRSLDEEFKKLFKLNRMYLDDVVDYPVELTKSEYENVRVTVIPTADPDTATDTEKLTKAQALMQLMGTGLINPQVVIRRVLEAMRIENIEELMNYEKQPSPEEKEMEHEMQIQQQEAELKEREAGLKQQSMQQDAMLKKRSQDQEYAHKERLQMLKERGEQNKTRAKMFDTAVQSRLKAQQAQQETRYSDLQHKQNLVHNAQSNQQKLQQQKQQAAMKPKAKDKGRK